MDAEKLLEALSEDSMARLRHAVLRQAGVEPFSLRAALIGRHRLLRYACHMVLDMENSGSDTDGFDMSRFYALKGEEHGGI